jgi:hypothetical protein
LLKILQKLLNDLLCVVLGPLRWPLLQTIPRVAVDWLAALRIQTSADSQQLARNFCTSYNVSTSSVVFEDVEFAPLTDFLPALNQELRIEGSLSLAVQLLQSFAYAHGNVAPRIWSSIVVAVQRAVQPLEAIDGLLQSPP